MRVVVVGAGKVGAHLAETLFSGGHQVVIIEKKLEICQELAAELPGILVIHGDGCDVQYLQDANTERADILAAVSGDDDDNLVSCQLAKVSFNVPRTVARINSPKNEHIFHALGIEGISSTTIITSLIQEEATVSDITTISALRGGNYALVEGEIPETSPILGRAIRETNPPDDCVLVAILRQDRIVIPRGSVVLESGDRVVALTPLEREELLQDTLAGRYMDPVRATGKK